MSSLPYHNPLMLADRMVLLDHITRGRAMLGCGPGQLTSDAHMLGIPADEQRPRMEQCLDVIMRLLRGETVTMHTDGFTLQDARLQLKPYSDPCFDIAVAASFSPTGPRGAGQARHRHVVDRCHDEAGHGPARPALGDVGGGRARARPVADRSKWRLVGPMHLAETREQAERDVEYGIAEFSRYFSHLLPAGPVQGDTPAEIIANNHSPVSRSSARPTTRSPRSRSSSRRATAVSAPFCCSITTGPPAAKLHSYELFAEYVMPHFTGQLAGPAASQDWVIGSGTEFMDRAAHAIGKSIQDHAAEQAAKKA